MNRLRLGLGFALLIMVLDQISKWVIVFRVMRPEGVEETPFLSFDRIELTPFFNLVMTWNRGVSFGIMNNDGNWNAVILSVLSLGIAVALVVWLRRVTSLRLALALGSIIGGALGNVVDRVRWGAVADFLDFHVMGHHWPAFNVADSGIVMGALILVLDSLFTARTSSKS